MGSQAGQRIVEAVMYGRYEEALDLPPLAARSIVNRRHIQKLARHRQEVRVVEALNKAKNAIITESAALKGRRYFAQGKDAEALEALERCPASLKTAEDHHLIGRIQSKLNRNRDAVLSFERVLNLRSDPVDHCHLGNAYSRLGEHEMARKCFESAVAMRGMPVDYQSLGRTYFELGRYAEAHKMLGRAFKTDSAADFDLLKRSRALARRQRLRELLGRSTDGTPTIWPHLLMLFKLLVLHTISTAWAIGHIQQVVENYQAAPQSVCVWLAYVTASLFIATAALHIAKKIDTIFTINANHP